MILQWNRICLPTEHLKSAQELVRHVSVHSGSNWNFAVLVFEGRGKPEYPESKERTNNKLKPHMTPGSGIEPGSHWWEASAHHCFTHSVEMTNFRFSPIASTRRLKLYFLGYFGNTWHSEQI